MKRAYSSSEAEPAGFTPLAMLVLAVTLVGIYVIVRYRGLWGETDTSAFTKFIRAVQDSGRLVPAHNAYPNGYAYQVVALWIVQASGVGLSTLQLYLSPLLAVWIVLPAWLLYRRLTDSLPGAVLGTSLLIVQPEVLFPLLRGTHEKFTRGLMLLALYILVRSLEVRHVPERRLSWILVFYLTVYAMITFNSLLTASFIAATMLALLFLWVLWGFARQSKSSHLVPISFLRRLTFVVFIPSILVYLFIFYIYPPALHNLRILESIWDRLIVLFLGFETSTNPFRVVAPAWRTLSIYFILSLANWLTLLGSVCIWSIYCLRWLRGSWCPNSYGEVLLWSFYGAFTTLGVFSILADVSGAVAGNLQHRMFPSFAMMAVPLLSWWLVRHQPHQKWQRRTAHTVLGITIFCLAASGVLKATNEPLLSNKWLFYIPAERAALRWANENLPDHMLWTAYDERLSTAVQIQVESFPLQVQLDWDLAKPGTRDFLVSDVTRARSHRLGRMLPIEADSLITYDNGSAQIYHLRPRTPFQK